MLSQLSFKGKEVKVFDADFFPIFQHFSTYIESRSFIIIIIIIIIELGY